MTIWIGPVCGGVWDNPSGLIQSPNFPNPYPHNQQCIYVIALDPGKIIELDFPVFDIEDMHSCAFDYLEVNFSRSIFDAVGDLVENYYEMCFSFRYGMAITVTRRSSAGFAETPIRLQRRS